MPDKVVNRFSPDEWRAIEDAASTILEWPREQQALAYLQLRRGAQMTTDEAERIVRRERPR